MRRAACRVLRAAAAGARTWHRPGPTRIAELRQQRGLSQEALSGQLRVQQATYSKLERRGDMKISSLRKAIEAMGGKLRIQAVFPDTKEVRDVQLQ